MADPTIVFFDNLRERGHDARLEGVSGTMRFDIEDGERVERWVVHIEDGDLDVSREERDADTLIRTDGETLARIVVGEDSSVAAWLRGRFKIHGSLVLLRYFERIFPGPPGARDPRRVGRTKAPAGPPHATVGADPVAAAERRVGIMDGNTFVVTDRRGDIDPTPHFPTGFFAFETRFLSRWHLTVNGQRVEALSVDDLQYYETRYFLIPGAPSHEASPELSVIRQHSITGSLVEELTVVNHRNEPVDVRVRLDIGSDFADISEVESVQQERGHRYVRVESGRLRLGYERDTFCRETLISSTEPPQVDEGGMTFDVRIEPQRHWSTVLHVEALGSDGRDVRTSLQGTRSRPKQQMRQDLDDWLSRLPMLRCDWQTLSAGYRRSLVDLAALRYRLMGPNTNIPAAGLPWFMSLFGRDSILTSLQTLPYTAELAVTTLRLGIQRGKHLDDVRDEEPGKIWQSARLGEAAAFDEGSHCPSFDAADTTPLWLVLLDEYERWTGDADLIRKMEPEARMCLAWIDSYADALGNGYIWYQSRNPQNSVNQCWKSSWDAISYHDGRLPDLPRATCELQGYAYDAKLRAARLARTFWDDAAYAEQLERQAADLADRFNRDFWIEDRQYYALALDPDGHHVDALASNIGHLLWSGIVPPERAKHLADHLTGPQLFSGWGVRTLSADAQRYNPLGYHVGTVWPFDNALIVSGLRRYGFAYEAALVADAVIEASEFFGNRLPEAYAGYDRSQTKYPVLYPSACSPYAMSAGAMLHLLRSLLGLDPRGDHLKVEPALPKTIGRLELLEIPGRWGRSDAFGRGRIDVRAGR